MLVGVLLLSFLGQQTFGIKIKDINVACLIVDLEYVQCNWNGEGINYTFYSWFYNKLPDECSSYILENDNVTGCKQPYKNLNDRRFDEFKTTLKNGNFSQEKTYDLTDQVKLNPPVNLSVTNRSDHELIFSWDHTKIPGCVQSEVRYRNNGKTWQSAVQIPAGRRQYPVSQSRSIDIYEFTVRSRIDEMCHASAHWSEWSQPVYWGSTKKKKYPDDMSLLTPVLSVLAALTLIILVIMLIHRERLRVIVVPAYLHNFPDDGNLTDWLRIPPEIKKGFDSKFDECDCSVRKYNQVPQTGSELKRSGCNPMPTDQSEDLSMSCSSYSSFVSLPALFNEEQEEV